MNYFDRLIAVFSPERAIRNELARRQLSQITNRHEAAMPGRFRQRNVVSNGPSTEAALGAVEIRERARYEEQNSDVVRGALDVLVGNIVGTGINVEPQIRLEDGELAVDANKMMHDLWLEHCESPEVTKELTKPQVQQLQCRTQFRDGEFFTQQLIGKVPGYQHTGEVPYAVELIEPDLVPIVHTDAANGIFYGIKKNKWGQPLKYFVYKEDPREAGRYFASQDYREIQASRMIHGKLVDRIGQMRGVSAFASVLNRLSDVRDFEESERIAARIAAAQVMVITRPASSAVSWSGNTQTSADGQTDRLFSVSPGAVWDNMAPGEEPKILSSDRPNNNIEAFRNSQLRSAAAGLGVSYSSLAKHYDGSYSSQRQELVEQSIVYSRLRGNFIDSCCKPDWYGFVQACIAAGLLDTRGLDRKTLYKADFRGPPMPWIDPVKEIDAELLLINNHLKSASQTIRERGNVPADVWRQIELDKQTTDKFVPQGAPDAKPVLANKPAG